MKYRIIRKIPKYAPGGEVPSGSPYQLTPGVGNSTGLYVTKTYDENGEIEINPFSLELEPLSAPMDIRPGVVDVNRESQMMQEHADRNISQATQQRILDGNPLDSMSMPYFAPDLVGRAMQLGQSISNRGMISDMFENAETDEQRTAAGFARGANIMQGIGAGVSLGLGFSREMSSMMSQRKAQQRDMASYRNKLTEERRNSFIRYGEGGSVYLGKGNGTFDSRSLTGEYLYPLPKSMEEQANVEIEKGEYVLRPDVVGPMEAKGNKHSNGGTLVDLEEANIVSDYRKITDDFANHIRAQYGIKVSPKDSYATVIDKYKSKIGLKQKYEDMEKLLKRLEKNDSVKDKNTSMMNKSVLSKYISESQTEIDELEMQLRKFADVVYEAQEAEKRQIEMSDFFRDGGPVDIVKVRQTAKAAGLTEDEAKNILFDEYIKMRRKMAEGGPTEEQINAGKKKAALLRDIFGRQLNFGIVDVAELSDVLKAGTGVNDNQGLQHKTDGIGYDGLRKSSLTNLLDLHRWAGNLSGEASDYSEFNVEGFQTGYNNQLNQLWALAEAGGINNANDAKNFRNKYGFWGQTMVSPKGEHSPDQAYNSFAVDGKYGRTTASRSLYSLDVLTPEQKSLLNQKGIKNFVDLFGDKSEEAKAVLGDDYKKFQRLKDSGDFDTMDFVMESYIPTNIVPDRQVEGYNSEISPVPAEAPVPVEAPVQPTTGGGAGKRQYSKPQGSLFSGIAGAIFPEVLRAPQSPMKYESLERHQAPRVNPVLRSADQYINEMHRNLSFQMDALGDVPDSQRAAIMANMNAIAGSNIAKFINQVDYDNARQINEADRFNEMAYAQTDDKNIAERQRYEAGVLKAEAIADENLARYLDSLNSEIQSKFNVATSLNTIRSIAPDIAMLPNGQLAYVGRDVLTPGAYSNVLLGTLNGNIKKEE